MRQFATLRNFVEDTPKRAPDEFGPALEQVANALAGSGEKGYVQLRIVSRPEPFYACLDLSPKQCTMRFEKVEKPNLELITSDDTAWRILEGSLSPLEAFLRGKMRIRGDAVLGKRLLQIIASSPEAEFDICETGV